jgi:hypothetical protein
MESLKDQVIEYVKERFYSEYLDGLKGRQLGCA